MIMRAQNERKIRRKKAKTRTKYFTIEQDQHARTEIEDIFSRVKHEKRKNLESVEYSKSFPLVEKTIKATSASQRTEIS